MNTRERAAAEALSSFCTQTWPKSSPANDTPLCGKGPYAKVIRVSKLPATGTRLRQSSSPTATSSTASMVQLRALESGRTENVTTIAACARVCADIYCCLSRLTGGDSFGGLHLLRRYMSFAQFWTPSGRPCRAAYEPLSGRSMRRCLLPGLVIAWVLRGTRFRSSDCWMRWSIAFALLTAVAGLVYSGNGCSASSYIEAAYSRAV